MQLFHPHSWRTRKETTPGWLRQEAAGGLVEGRFYKLSPRAPPPPLPPLPPPPRTAMPLPGTATAPVTEAVLPISTKQRCLRPDRRWTGAGSMVLRRVLMPSSEAAVPINCHWATRMSRLRLRSHGRGL